MDEADKLLSEGLGLCARARPKLMGRGEMLGTPIVCVQAGTMIEMDGKWLAVTDTEAVMRKGTMYVSHKVYNSIKARARSQAPKEAENG